MTNRTPQQRAELIRKSSSSRMIWHRGDDRPSSATPALVAASLSDPGVECIVLPAEGDLVDLGDDLVRVLDVRPLDAHQVELVYLRPGPDVVAETFPHHRLHVLDCLEHELDPSYQEWFSLVREGFLTLLGQRAKWQELESKVRTDLTADGLPSDRLHDMMGRWGLETPRIDRDATVTFTLEVELTAPNIPADDSLGQHVCLDSLEDALREHLPREDWEAGGAIITGLTFVDSGKLTEA